MLVAAGAGGADAAASVVFASGASCAAAAAAAAAAWVVFCRFASGASCATLSVAAGAGVADAAAWGVFSSGIPSPFVNIWRYFQLRKSTIPASVSPPLSLPHLVFLFIHRELWVLSALLDCLENHLFGASLCLKEAIAENEDKEGIDNYVLCNSV